MTNHEGPWFYGVVTSQGTEGVLQLMTSETLKSSKNPQGADSCQQHEWALKSDPSLKAWDFSSPFCQLDWNLGKKYEKEEQKGRTWISSPKKRQEINFFKPSGFRVICYEAVYNSRQPTCL